MFGSLNFAGSFFKCHKTSIEQKAWPICYRHFPYKGTLIEMLKTNKRKKLHTDTELCQCHEWWRGDYHRKQEMRAPRLIESNQWSQVKTNSARDIFHLKTQKLVCATYQTMQISPSVQQYNFPALFACSKSRGQFVLTTVEIAHAITISAGRAPLHVIWSAKSV